MLLGQGEIESMTNMTLQTRAWKDLAHVNGGMSDQVHLRVDKGSKDPIQIQ